MVPKDDYKSFGIKINASSYLGACTVLPENLNKASFSYRFARNFYVRKADAVADVCDVARLHDVFWYHVALEPDNFVPLTMTT